MSEPAQALARRVYAEEWKRAWKRRGGSTTSTEDVAQVREAAVATTVRRTGLSRATVAPAAREAERAALREWAER